MELGRVGIWFGRDRWQGVPVEQVVAAAAELERLGFGALWMSAGFGSTLPDVFGACVAGTSRIVLATGILTVWHVPAAEAAAATAALETAHPGRFLLGLGASHAPIVEDLGAAYARPYSKVVEYLDQLDQGDPPVPAKRRALAALGPRMLALSAERSAGAHPYFVPVEHTAAARTTLGAGPLLAPEQAVLLESDPARARAVARHHTRRYLQLPNYVNNLLRLGFSPDDVAGDGSDRLVDAIVAWGDADTVAGRVREHHDAGADHVCLQVLTEPGTGIPAEHLARLAAATLG
jgi:probable F420-dependent oxidoreductase